MNLTNNKKYMMHKYWGKKPAIDLRRLILEYSNEGDLLLDPFAGYGGLSSEAILSNRNVISNDLNPVANFINKALLSKKINFDRFYKMILEIKEKTKESEKFWYSYKDGIIITTLRNSNDDIIGIKTKEDKDRKLTEVYDLENNYSIDFLLKENNFKIDTWYPTNKLIANSRISAKAGMNVSDLFTKRALACHSLLYSIILSFEDSPERDLLILSFTSNLANCSKLVPPIKSRGKMSQGAWMTGFYVGDTYLENNVYHYFMNRVNKVIAGKKEYLNEYNSFFPKGEYKITNYDAKDLKIEDNSIDFIFTDFPYGDSVPYFEQSIIWNSWLQKQVDYDNEIVISDSKIRKKGSHQFRTDIDKAISEIYRVLVPGKYFVFTFHSISGFEWTSITNAILKNKFSVAKCTLLTQKTLPPRQLSRNNTIKGDLLVVCKKENMEPIELLKSDSNDIIRDLFIEVIEGGSYETNDVIVNFLTCFLNKRIIVKDENLFSQLYNVAKFDGKGWTLK